VTVATWGLAGLALAVVAAVAIFRLRANRIAVRAVYRARSRVDRFKLTKKKFIRVTLVADPEIARAVKAHSTEYSVSEETAWKLAEGYIDEIVPFFNILTYYKFGVGVSRVLLNFFYKVSAEYAGRESNPPLRRDAIVIYLMNHRSNADYVLVSYLLSGQVAISYAVGEWARTFPLEHIFKSFGAYFIRRKYRERLYQVVLERYVQLITRNGVTQGIFLEGGLSRDGRLGKAKIGLLDYLIGVARDDSLRERLYVVPVGINYDRVLEDRSLLRELDAREGRKRPARFGQLSEVLRYVSWNLARIVARKWKRYGRASLVIGEPYSLAPWLDAEDKETGGFFALARTERLQRVQLLADTVLEQIAAIIPVTPVPLACAALQTFDGDFVTHTQLVARMEEMRGVLHELNARVIHREGAIEEVFDRAWRMLEMRRILVRVGTGYSILPTGRALVSYYANSIVHLLGPFSEGIRERDALPALAFEMDGLTGRT
jgi:glycerol-3-phosphate O-acyltransferase